MSLSKSFFQLSGLDMCISQARSLTLLLNSQPHYHACTEDIVQQLANMTRMGSITQGEALMAAYLPGSSNMAYIAYVSIAAMCHDCSSMADSGCQRA